MDKEDLKELKQSNNILSVEVKELKRLREFEKRVLEYKNETITELLDGLGELYSWALRQRIPPSHVYERINEITLKIAKRENKGE